MRKASFSITLGPSDQAQLEQWESAQGTPQQVALRCRIVLLALAGEQNHKLFTDTWLGAIESGEVWVRYMWWPDKRRDGRTRIANDYIIVLYGATETLRLAEGLELKIEYEKKS